MSRANIGTKAIRLRRSSDNAEQDFFTIRGGGLDLSTIQTFKGADNLFCTTVYDQTGRGDDLSQSSAAAQPAFSIIDGRGYLDNTSSSGVNLNNSAYASRAGPWSAQAVYKATSFTTTYGTILATHDTNGGFWARNDDFITFWGFSAAAATALTGTFHVVHGVANNSPNGLVAAEGSIVSADTGSGSLDGGVNVFTDGGLVSDKFAGLWGEGMFWANTVLSSGQVSSLAANARAFWGF